jgi:hypothetical protein
MKYRCLRERFIDIEADDKKDAQEKALIALLNELLEGDEPFIVREMLSDEDL